MQSVCSDIGTVGLPAAAPAGGKGPLAVSKQPTIVSCQCCQGDCLQAL